MQDNIDKKFEEELQATLDCAKKLDEFSMNTWLSPEVGRLLRKNTSNVEALVRMVKTYDKNIKSAIHQMMELKHQLDDCSFEWTLAQTLMDKKVVSAIELMLSEIKKTRTESEEEEDDKTCE